MHQPPPSRRFPRVPIDVRVTELSGELLCQVRARDISATGLFVDLLDEAVLPKDGLLAVEFTLPEDDEPVWATCEVVRDQQLGHALQFTRIAEPDRARVQRYVQSYFRPLATPLAPRRDTGQPERQLFRFRAVGALLG